MSADEKPKRSYVMKGSENSMPEKKSRKPRWTALRMTCEFVRTAAAVVAALEEEEEEEEEEESTFSPFRLSSVVPLPLAEDRAGRVSGSAAYR